jgi:subtilisin family serine protease
MYDEEFAQPAMAAKYGLDRTYILELPGPADTAAMAQAFAGLREDVEFATVDALGGVADFLPNDPFFSFQWAMHNTGQFIGTCINSTNSGSLCHTSTECPGGSCSGRLCTANADINAPAAWEIHAGLNPIVADGVDGTLSGDGTVFQSKALGDLTALGIDPARDRMELLSGGSGTYKPGVYRIAPPVDPASVTLSRSAGNAGAAEIPFRIGPATVVAIVDSGVATHAEFSGRLLPGRNTYDILNPTVTNDQCGHGTHVAGIAAAGGHNNVGVAGVNWGAKILPIRILGPPAFGNPCGPGTTASLANGIIWAADNGADIANFSLQYYLDSFPNDQLIVQNAIDYAKDLGMLLVAATGNNGAGGADTIIAHPAKSQHTLAVGGTNCRDMRATGAGGDQFTSNRGNQIDLMGPGDRVYSTSIANGFAFLSGTSMATPHVTGLASLLKSYAPHLTNHDLADILIATVKDLGTAGWDMDTGFGRIDALAAMSANQDWPVIIASFPANHAIDAGQPTDSNLFFEFGWDVIELTLPPELIASVTVQSFRIVQKGGVPGDLPMVVDIAPSGPDTVVVQLDSAIGLEAWTTLVYEAAGSVTLGFLPADVNANLISNAEDALALVSDLEAIEAGEPVLPPWSTDLDRSSLTTPLDLLTCMDLLNGADLHIKWLDKTVQPRF